MKLTFKKPENGWLPIKFENENFHLEFTSSKIPENPTSEFCQNLILSAQGLDTITNFNIEPHFYTFKILKENEEYTFEIEFHSESTDRFDYTIIDKKIVFKKTGNFDKIILPLYRTIKKFTTLDYRSSDWTEIDSNKIEKLEEIIAKEKANKN